MIISPQINLGDIVVSLATIGSIWLAYQSMKGQIAGFRTDLTGFRAELTSARAEFKEQGEAQRRHGRILDTHETKIARIEGAVFNRRSGDPVNGDVDAIA